MDIGFLFGWAKEQGVDLPTKADGSINIPAAFALYDEWKKKGGEGKEKDGNGKFSENGSPSSITRKRTNSSTTTGAWKTCPVSCSWSALVRRSTRAGGKHDNIHGRSLRERRMGGS